ncbi:redoxin domain-containing protein [Sphingomonas sp.]|uniref:redoxin domain-containing protein n=1 Tax=Sphingomonas sp. TaxID=28214 RepID=UPI003B3AECE3
MKPYIAVIVALGAAPALFAAAAVGRPAPDFAAKAADGRTVRLADYRGKTVVLEWNNPGCPFVQKHYKGNMQKTQAAARAAGAVWLTVNSGAPGQQGHMSGPEAVRFVRSAKAVTSAYLLDPDGAIGRLYGARTTPHMFVIAPDGRLAYAGGIDDIPSADVADLPKAKNMVLAALTDLKAGRPVATRQARAYGCSVKYAS